MRDLRSSTTSLSTHSLNQVHLSLASLQLFPSLLINSSLVCQIIIFIYLELFENHNQFHTHFYRHL